MRRVHLPAIVLFGAAFFGSVSGVAWAQTNPSLDQLVRSLTPSTPGGVDRGIHIVRPGTRDSDAGMAPPSAPVSALPSASLSVQFATGSANLTTSAVDTLDLLGKALTDPRIAGSNFRIEGHTDTVGTPEGNQALSEARAKAVASYLASAYHVDPSKLEAVGMGEDGLLVKTPSQVPEARNRRVVIVNLGG